MPAANPVGFPTTKPYGYPNASYPRVQVTQDVLRCDGALKVAQGAKGIVVANDRGFLTVLFEEGQDLHIEVSGCGRLMSQVPSLSVREIPQH